MYFDKFEFFILLLCSLFVMSSLTNDCSPQYCNLAGECSLVDNKPSCKCYEETFHGQYCEKVNDLCQTEKNPCQISESCVPYIGQMICNNQEPKGELKTPTNPICSYNVRAVYGTKQYIVLSFEELNALELDITVSTPTYLISHVNATVSCNPTKNLTATLDELGIRRHMRIPYSNACYYLFEATYFTLGANQLTVDIESYHKRNSSKQSLSLMVHVVKPRSKMCYPKIVFQQGMDPKKPREVDVEHFTNIQAIVENRCYPSENTFRTQWTIFNFEETISLFATSFGRELLFKIPHYSLWYKDLLYLHPNILLSVRMAFKETNTPWIHTRCYLKVTARNVLANIAGGHLREVNQDKWLILDGSKSRDPARRPGIPQQLMYTWLLSSEDGSNEEYLAFQSNHAKLNIPAKVLNKGITNRITLKVASRSVPNRSSTATQMIRVVADRIPMNLDIECIRNCQSNLYDVDTVLHLRAICSRCRLPINYTWTLNGVDMQQNKPRLVTKVAKDFAGEIVIKLGVKERTAMGYTELKLQKSQAPILGNCIIEPKSGIECITRFHVHCGKVKTFLSEPVLYTFRLGNIYEENNNSGETFLYLNGQDSLTVRICGFQFPCVLKEIHFTVEPMPVSDLKDLRNNSSRTLEEGRRQQVFCMLQMIAAKSDMDVMLQYIQAMKFDRIFTLLELVNTLEIVHKSLINVAPLQSYDAYVISYLLERVVLNFDFIRRDNEILDMTDEICCNLVTLLTEIVKYCLDSNENLEKELIGKDSDDLYVDWSPFNITVTQRINRYSKFVELILKMFQMIGQELPRHIQPEESFDYVTEQVSYKAKMYEKYEPILYKSNDAFCTFEVPLSSVDDLRQQLESSELMLHTWCFKSNIFWWAPEVWPPTTALLAVNIFGRDGRSTVQPTDSANIYKLSLRRVGIISTDLIHMTEILYHSMVIYKVQLDDHVNLLVDFLNTSKSLRVLITMNAKPRLNQDASCLIPAAQRRSIILKNRCAKTGTAYIAIYREDPFDSSSVTYTIRLTAQECGVWGVHDKNPMWIRKFCQTQNWKQKPLYSNCTINHLSVFAAKEYSINPLLIQKSHEYVNNFSLNVSFNTFNILLILGNLSLLFLAKMRLHSKKMNLIRVIKSNRDEVPLESENIIVQLQTGGMLLAGSTANIKLEFKSDLGRYKVVIYQNPMDPQLGVNTSCTVRLSDEKVQLPCRLTISHDHSGRYPSWYCRSVQVNDLRRNLTHTFPIHSWIERGQKIRVSSYSNDSKHININGRFKNKFRQNIEFYFVNWFMFQPILGPWRYNTESNNIYERICIWTCKTILTVALVFCYYRSYENTFTSIDLYEFLIIAIGSYFATIIFELIITQLIKLLKS